MATIIRSLHPTYRVVLQEAAAGFTEAEAAEHLGLTRSQVHNRVRAARKKLGARSTGHAIALALRAGVLPEID